MQFHVVADVFSLKEGICLVPDSWDDWFRYATTFTVYYKHDMKCVRIGSAKIGEYGLRPSKTKARGARTPELPEQFQRLGSAFFSLGQDVDYYVNLKKLEDEFDGHFREEFLEALNDIAYDLSLFQSCKDERVVIDSLMRSVSAPMINGQFHRIAKGGSELAEYEFSFVLPLRTESLASPQDLEIAVNPESIPPSNVHVVIGRNGVGKTHLIRSLISAAFEQNREVASGYYYQIDRCDRINPLEVFSNFICIGFSAFDDLPSEVTPKGSDGKSDRRYEFIGLDHISSSGASGFEKEKRRHDAIYASSQKRLDAITESFRNRIQSISRNPLKESLLEEAVRYLKKDDLFSRHLDEVLPSISDVTESRPLDDDQPEERMEAFKKLSSGHKIALLIVACLVDAVVEKSFVVLDEPENHLHPPLLAALMRAISYIVKKRNGVVLVMTHSPIVLQEVPANCAWQMRRLGDQVSLRRISMPTFGSDINTLMREIFGYEILNTGFHEMVRQVLDQNQGSFEESLSQFAGELGSEGIALLAALSEDGREGSND